MRAGQRQQREQQETEEHPGWPRGSLATRVYALGIISGENARFARQVTITHAVPTLPDSTLSYVYT